MSDSGSRAGPSRVGLYLLRSELKVMRCSDVAENDVAGDIPVRTSNPNPNLLQSTKTGKRLLADLLWINLIIDGSSYSIYVRTHPRVVIESN